MLRFTSFEMASRLAFLLWNSLPDDMLLDQAAHGMLGTVEGVRAAATRLLDAPAGRQAIGAFAEEYMRLDRIGSQAKDAKPGDPSSQPRVDAGVLYTMRCLDEFLTKLEQTPHGSSTLLDSTLIYVTSDTAWGKTHTKTEWPVLLAGKAAGRLRGDEHHNFPGDNLTKVLLTIAELMGSNVAEIGVDAGKVTTPLAGIRV